MGKTCYVTKALASKNPDEVFLECMEDVKASVGKVLGERYLPIDLPIIIAGLKLLTAALEQHPAVGDPGRALIAHLLDIFHVCDTSGLSALGHRTEEE